MLKHEMELSLKLICRAILCSMLENMNSIIPCTEVYRTERDSLLEVWGWVRTRGTSHCLSNMHTFLVLMWLSIKEDFNYFWGYTFHSQHHKIINNNKL